MTRPDAALGRPTNRNHAILIPFAALIAVLPLIVHGCSCGHDLDFHLVNWMEAARQFSQGNLHPHWAFSPAFNAGEPRFVFYPPLSWILGAILGLFLTHLPGVSQTAAWTAAPILFTWIALTLSGLTLYRLARDYASSLAALLAAVVYLASPYMLFTAYERTAYAELLAAAWIPILFRSILRERITVSGIALPIALLWLTNAPAAVMGSYTLALLAAIRCVVELRAARRSSALQLALKTAGGTALGLALAAFYIVPAAYQRRFVQISMATIGGMRIDQNFLFEHTGTSSDALLHDQVLRTASLTAILLLAATAIALCIVFLRRASTTDHEPGPRRFPLAALAILTTGIAFLLTPLAAPIWMHAPEAAFLQFPWRLLAILATVFALTLARAVTPLPTLSVPMRKISATAVLLLAVAFSLPAYHLFHQPCDPEDTASAQLTSFQTHAGTDPTDEYTPTTADNDALKPIDPPYWLATRPDAPAPPSTQSGPAPTHLTLAAPAPEFLILNLREFPAWHVFLNGVLDSAPAQEENQRPDGLIAVPIPAGPSTIDLHYTQSFDQTIGDGITLLALAICPFALRRDRPASA